MNPEMMKMASEMMSKMSPEQLAQMQRQASSMMQQPGMMEQAMNMMNNMSPEELRRAQQMAANMPPEHLASQAGNFAGGAASGSGAAGSGASHYSAALQLKTEGNGLFGQRRYREAAAKYESAITRLQGDFSQQSKELRTSCQGNLAFCCLELGQHQQCVEQCNAVLAADSSNRKAFYRRGQAHSALGKVDAAVEDLRRALLLSPENEKGVIREKLQEAEQKQRHASRGVVIEEVTEPAPAAADQGMPQQQQQQRGRQRDEEVDGQIEDLPAPPPPAPAPAPAPVPAPAAAAAPMGGMGGGGFPAVDPQHVQRVAEMMKSNPAYLQTMAEQMRNMSPEQLAEALRHGGGAAAGITPEMAKSAAEAMKGMPAEQLRAMADQAIAATGGSGSAGGGFALPPEMAAAAASSDPNEQMRAAAAAMKSNPDMLKSAARMMESMSPEQLEAMAASMPGGMPGMKIDPEQVRMAAKMMETMSPEDLERMADMARSMGGMPGAAGTAPGGSAAPAVAAGSAGGGAMPAMPAGFDPSNMPPDMMNDMRKKMGDPAMMKMMQNMLKSMDPEALASMMSQGGMKITPEQAQKMKDSLGGMSDQQMEALARITRYINVLIDAFQKAKAFVLSQGLMVAALLVLLLAILLRWLGWI